MKQLAAALIAVVAIVAVSTTPASAAPIGEAQVRAELGKPATSAADLQRKIDLQLKVAPGGKQVGANEVSYDGGNFVVTYAMPNAIQASQGPDCPSDYFCFYQNSYFYYPRGKLRDCGWQDLAAYGWSDRTRSVDNGSNSLISFIEHDDQGNPNNGHIHDYNLFQVTNWSQWQTVPHPARADHVRRTQGSCGP